MSKIRDLVRLPYQATVSGSGTGKVTAARVKTGQVLVCQSLAFKNATGARGTATLQVRQGEAVYPVTDQLSPGADTWYTYPHEVCVNEGEQVEVSQASCSASDKLHLVILGYVEYKKEVYPPG